MPDAPTVVPAMAMRRCGQVALIGRPNVGKSTLLNRLLGETWSISSPRPQTTRNRVLGLKTGPGFQVAYVDTPGLQSQYGGELNRRMRREAITALHDTTVTVFLVEALSWRPEVDAQVLGILQTANASVFLAINKIDRVKPKERLLPFIDQLAAMHDYAAIVPISARNGTQVDVLEKRLLAQLPLSASTLAVEEGRPPLDERSLAAELLRAELLLRLGDELPYCLSVRVEHLARIDGIAHVHASIWVETEGQKRIVVGRGGRILKIAGSRARARLERRWGQQVNLRTWVFVVRNWSASVARLEELTRD